MSDDMSGLLLRQSGIHYAPTSDSHPNSAPLQQVRDISKDTNQNYYLHANDSCQRLGTPTLKLDGFAVIEAFDRTTIFLERYQANGRAVQIELSRDCDEVHLALQQLFDVAGLEYQLSKDGDTYCVYPNTGCIPPGLLEGFKAQLELEHSPTSQQAEEITGQSLTRHEKDEGQAKDQYQRRESERSLDINDIIPRTDRRETIRRNQHQNEIIPTVIKDTESAVNSKPTLHLIDLIDVTVLEAFDQATQFLEKYNSSGRCVCIEVSRDRSDLHLALQELFQVAGLEYQLETGTTYGDTYCVSTSTGNIPPGLLEGFRVQWELENSNASCLPPPPTTAANEDLTTTEATSDEEATHERENSESTLQSIQDSRSQPQVGSAEEKPSAQSVDEDMVVTDRAVSSFSSIADRRMKLLQELEPVVNNTQNDQSHEYLKPKDPLKSFALPTLQLTDTSVVEAFDQATNFLERYNDRNILVCIQFSRDRSVLHAALQQLFQMAGLQYQLNPDGDTYLVSTGTGDIPPGLLEGFKAQLELENSKSQMEIEGEASEEANTTQSNPQKEQRQEKAEQAEATMQSVTETVPSLHYVGDAETVWSVERNEMNSSMNHEALHIEDNDLNPQRGEQSSYSSQPRMKLHDAPTLLLRYSPVIDACNQVTRFLETYHGTGQLVCIAFPRDRFELLLALQKLFQVAGVEYRLDAEGGSFRISTGTHVCIPPEILGEFKARWEEEHSEPEKHQRIPVVPVKVVEDLNDQISAEQRTIRIDASQVDVEYTDPRHSVRRLDLNEVDAGFAGPRHSVRTARSGAPRERKNPDVDNEMKWREKLAEALEEKPMNRPTTGTYGSPKGIVRKMTAALAVEDQNNQISADQQMMRIDQSEVDVEHTGPRHSVRRFDTNEVGAEVTGPRHSVRTARPGEPRLRNNPDVGNELKWRQKLTDALEEKPNKKSELNRSTIDKYGSPKDVVRKTIDKYGSPKNAARKSAKNYERGNARIVNRHISGQQKLAIALDRELTGRNGNDAANRSAQIPFRKARNDTLIGIDIITTQPDRDSESSKESSFEDLLGLQRQDTLQKILLTADEQMHKLRPKSEDSNQKKNRNHHQKLENLARSLAAPVIRDSSLGGLHDPTLDAVPKFDRRGRVYSMQSRRDIAKTHRKCAICGLHYAFKRSFGLIWGKDEAAQQGICSSCKAKNELTAAANTSVSAQSGSSRSGGGSAPSESLANSNAS